MLDYLFIIFIAPLELLMRVTLEWGFAHTGSYGLSLILMSLVVNILLLPLYHLAETWQEAERAVQASMATQVARIKAVFHGREKYYMLRTLYRQHQYHPIMAVRTSFGLLIQVPFFFAAYHLLSNYTPLQGVSFWIFKDLALPDGLLSLGEYRVNVLPFVMTIINIVSALVYTSRLTQKDKIQLYSVAALFLVLFYTTPTGLVFYWTCNNAFSLLKNSFYNYFKILDNLKIHRKKAYNEIIYLFALVFISAPCILVYLNRGFFTGSIEYLSLATALFFYFLFYYHAFNQFLVRILSNTIIFIIGGLCTYILISITIFPVKAINLAGTGFHFHKLSLLMHIILLILSLVIYRKYSKFLQQILAIATVLSIVACGYIIATEKKYINTDRNIFQNCELGTECNILLLCYDMYQGSFVEKILQDNDSFSNDLDGFTFYRNAVSSGPYTSMSVLTLMHGEVLTQMRDNNVYNFKTGDTLVNDVIEDGYRASGTFPVNTGDQKYNLFRQFFIHTDKDYLFYYSVIRYIPLPPVNNKEWDVMSKKDAAINIKLFPNLLSINPDLKKSFLYYHTDVTHAPVRLRRNGIFDKSITANDVFDEMLLATDSLVSIISKLKELNIYDKTFIIVFGDHGHIDLQKMDKLDFPRKNILLKKIDHSSFFNISPMYIGQYNVALFIKPLNSHGRLKIEDKPVALTDIRITLNNNLLTNIQKNLSGIDIFSQQKISTRDIPILVYSDKENWETKNFNNFKGWEVRTLRVPIESPQEALDIPTNSGNVYK